VPIERRAAPASTKDSYLSWQDDIQSIRSKNPEFFAEFFIAR
jgi:hypothetical protein